MLESSDLSAGERGALRAVAHLLRQTMGLRLATNADRERTLRDFGLTPHQIAYVSHILTNARGAGVPAVATGADAPDIVAPDPAEVVRGEACPISWDPTILTPVFWGREHVAIGSRGTPVTIYYPSLDGAPDGAAMLRGCGGRALILFLHGHCQQENDHLHRWERHLAQLARSGFVVAAPFHDDIGGGPLQDSLLASALEVLEWMRNSWPGRTELHPAAATGICGHSYGAMLAGRVAVMSNAWAYASLSANWHEWSTFGTDVPEPLPEVTMPSLHMWGTEGLFSDEVTGARWQSIPGSKHRVILHGGSHWQYLQGQTGGCAPEADECKHLGSVAGDLMACFFARYLPPAMEHESGARIPISLQPPDVPLTFDQQFFAGGHLMGLKMIPFSEGCEITCGWETPSGSTGSITLSSPG